MSKKILIQGDDWGYNEATIAGINEAYTRGILTETDVMANLLDPSRKDEYRSLVKNLKNESGLGKPALGIGVHLNLTYGQPITDTWPFKEMARPYKGTSKPEEWQGKAWAEHFKSYDPELVEKEFRAQIERVIDIFDSIDHLDAHHFIHSYPPMKQVVLNLAQDYKVAVRATAPLSEKPVYGGDFVVDTELQAEIAPIGLKTTDRCVLTLFWNEPDPLEAFLKALSEAPEDLVTEFMVHPAKGEKAEDWRKKDLEIVTHPKTRQYFKDNDITLITYSELK
jgi:chitin disaccharide deacetylase